MLMLFKYIPKYILPDLSMGKKTKGKWLLDLCESFIDRYVFDSEHIDNLVQQMHQLEFASLGKHNCILKEWDKVFVYHSGRIR